MRFMRGKDMESANHASAVASRRVARPASYTIPPLDDFSTEDEDDSYANNNSDPLDGDAGAGDGAEEVSRCVCGMEDLGGLLMIQCDECKVWQHCTCMGLDTKKLPKKYSCELCKPNKHKNLKAILARSAGAPALQQASPSAPAPSARASSGRAAATATSQTENQAIPAAKPSKNNNASSKKRNTMNSRDAAQTFSDFLPLISGKAGSSDPQGQDPPSHSPPSTQGDHSKAGTSTSTSQQPSNESTRNHSPNISPETIPVRPASASLTRRPRSAAKRSSVPQTAQAVVAEIFNCICADPFTLPSLIACMLPIMQPVALARRSSRTSLLPTRYRQAEERNGLSTPVSSEEDLTAGTRLRRGSTSSSSGRQVAIEKESSASSTSGRASKRKRGSEATAPVSKRKASKSDDIASERNEPFEPSAVDDAGDIASSSSANEDEVAVSALDGDTDLAVGDADDTPTLNEAAESNENLARRPSTVESVASGSRKGKGSKRPLAEEEAPSDVEGSKDPTDIADQDKDSSQSKPKAATGPKSKKAKYTKAKNGPKAGAKNAVVGSPSSSQTTASAPKPKPLNPNMSMNDIRKRIKNISEYLERMQRNLAEEAAAQFPWFRLGVFPMSLAPGVLEACSPEVAEKIRRGAEEAAKELAVKAVAHATPDNDATAKVDPKDVSYLPTPPLSQSSASSSTPSSLSIKTPTAFTTDSQEPATSPPATPSSAVADLSSALLLPSGTSSGVAPSSRASNSSSSSPPNPGSGASSTVHPTSDSETHASENVYLEQLVRRSLEGETKGKKRGAEEVEEDDGERRVRRKEGEGDAPMGFVESAVGIEVRRQTSLEAMIALQKRIAAWQEKYGDLDLSKK
ncbi:hypothetical protein HDU67_000901 [Dinochytrium kinnereticum]|nr:hypothetical protein HDU67_000901 [Dinochytrium kinnereticum]